MEAKQDKDGRFKDSRPSKIRGAFRRRGASPYLSRKGFWAYLPSKLSRMFRRKENVDKRIGDTKRNVTLDSSVLISYVISKHNDTTVKKVVTKSVTDDRLMLTDVIFDECLRYTDKRKSRTTKENMSMKLRDVSPKIIDISPVPSTEELMKKYKVRDLDDLKILYSVEMTDSVILVTLDDDFTDVEGIKAKIMRPEQYLFEEKDKNKRRAERMR
ncbi:MAG: PIN domain-containing protein [Methanomassiliicoccaceae archaeon]|nr:PIN domain-containing protein [Methanomassiliicoccaceae archaeon]MCL2146108.1 PIN domain-containing protein [Methanomassiliicoccaceae archaeon]